MRRIVSDPEVLRGKPVLEGTRMSVEQILGLLANGMTPSDIAASWPILSEDDVRTVVAYAQAAVRNDVILHVA